MDLVVTKNLIGRRFRNNQRKHNKVKKYDDRGTRVKILKVNDLVLKLKGVALGLDQKHDGPYKIVKVTATDTYQLELVRNPTNVNCSC